MTKYLTDSMVHDKNTVTLLRRSNNHISAELKTVQEEHEVLKNAMPEVQVVAKLVHIDRIQEDLGQSRMDNASMNILMASLSTKIGAMREELYYLRKDDMRVQEKHAGIIKKRNEVVSLLSKVRPSNELLEMREKLDSESAGLKKLSEDLLRLKTEVPGLVSALDALKEELSETAEKVRLTQTNISSIKDRIKRLAPKVTSTEEIKRLEEEIVTMRPRQEELAKEKKELSPRIAPIAAEEEKLTSALEAYKSKNEQDRARLSEVSKEVKELGIDKDTLAALREKTASIEEEHEVKEKELEKAKHEYSDVLGSNQKYKAVIEEVEKGTQKLKDMMQV